MIPTPLAPSRPLAPQDAPGPTGLAKPRPDLFARLKHISAEQLAQPEMRALSKLLERGCWADDPTACQAALQTLLNHEEHEVLRDLLPSLPCSLARLQIPGGANAQPVMEVLLPWLAAAPQQALRHFSINNFCFTPGERELLVRALQKQTELEHLTLYDCELDEEDLHHICKAIPAHVSLLRLNLGGNEIEEVPAGLLQLIRANPLLEELILNDSDDLQDGSLEEIADALHAHTCLRQLSLSCCNLKDEDAGVVVSMLRRHTRLSSVNLGCNDFEGAGLRSIAGALQHHPSIRTFKAAYTEMAGAATAELVALLRTNTSLENLVLTSVQPIADGAASQIFGALAGNRTLRSLALSQFPGAELSQLPRAQGLQILDLRENCFEANDCELLARAVKQCPNLQLLNLSNCGLSNEALARFAHHLDPHASLTTLDLSSNPLPQSALLAAAPALLPKLPELTDLKLNRQWANLPREQPAALRAALSSQFRLQRLFEHPIPPTWAGIAALFERNRRLDGRAPWALGESLVVRFTERVLQLPDAGVFIWQSLVAGSRQDAAEGLTTALRLAQVAKWLYLDEEPAPQAPPTDHGQSAKRQRLN